MGDSSSARSNLSDTGRCQTFASEWSPNVVTTEVLPEALQPPDHVQLAIGKMFQKAVTDEPRDILPVVISFVGEFFLQDRADGNHRRKSVPEKQELEKELSAQHAQARGENEGGNPSDLEEGTKKLNQPRVGNRKTADPAVTPPEKHIAV